MIRRLSVLSIALVAMACSHSPVPREHSLFPPLGRPTVSATSPTPETTIAIVSCTVPESIDRPHWVLIDATGTLQVSSNERWSEPLKLAIPRLLAHEVQQALPDAVVWSATGSGSVRADVRLHVTVTAWEARVDSHARIDLVWHIDVGRTRRTGRAALVHAVDDATTDALLRAQRAALAQGGSHIALAVRDVLLEARP